MFKIWKEAFLEKSLRERILWTLGILLFYRFGTHITVPGVNPEAMTSLMNETSLLSVLNLLAGGGMAQYSLFALGVSPFITAQIIVQLLQQDIVPKLTEWSKQGETGRRKLNNLTKWLSIIIAFVQSIGITAGLETMSSRIGVKLLTDNSKTTYFLIALTMTIGTLFAMWLGNMIMEKGIGQGMSMIIMAGIVSSIVPSIWEMFRSDVLSLVGNIDGWIQFIVVILSVILVTGIVVYVYDGIRKIRIQYTRLPSSFGEESFLPLRVNVAGVIPVIFASSIITTPSTILTAFNSKWSTYSWYEPVSNIFNMQTYQGATLYALLIILFTYFYAFVQVNPEKLSENLQKQGAYIVGVRPGEHTKVFMTQVIMRLSGLGSIFLAAIAVLPIIVSNTNLLPRANKLAIGGTSLLIIVSASIDLTKQVKGLLLKKNYSGFISYPKKVKKGRK